MRIILGITFLFGTLFVSANAGADDRSERCDELWHDVSSRPNSSSGRDYQKLLTEWLKLEEQCKGTGIFEIRLALIHILRGQYDEGRRILGGAKIPPQYEALAATVRANADLRDILSSENPDRARLGSLEKTVTQLARKYPGHLPLHSLLGNLNVILGHYSNAIEPLENAARIKEGDRWGVFRNLTIAYSKVGNYQGALKAADQTFEIYKGVTNDEDFMYALAIANAGTGDVEATKDVLSLILTKKPHLQNDPEFKETVGKARELTGGRLK